MAGYKDYISECLDRLSEEVSGVIAEMRALDPVLEMDEEDWAEIEAGMEVSADIARREGIFGLVVRFSEGKNGSRFIPLAEIAGDAAESIAAPQAFFDDLADELEAHAKMFRGLDAKLDEEGDRC
jgi:hypothetical protein